jgi:hypothetical protein
VPASERRSVGHPNESVQVAEEEFGISGGGRDAEERFRELTGAERTERAALGDAVLEGRVVEIKRATATTLNQVRAVKFIVLVASYCPAGAAPSWYVIPGHRVVELVAAKARGQHTENPFESATLSIKALSEFRVTAASLRQAVLDAASADQQYPELRAEMNRVLEQSRALAKESRERVAETMHSRRA